MNDLETNKNILTAIHEDNLGHEEKKIPLLRADPTERIDGRMQNRRRRRRRSYFLDGSP